MIAYAVPVFVLLVPPVLRLAGGAAQHFRDSQAFYAPSRLPLDRIHVELITNSMDYVVDYAAKGLRSRRIDHDDGVFVQPRSTSEMR